MNTKLNVTHRIPKVGRDDDINRLSSTYAADLSLPERMALARECDRMGLKAKAAMIRSGIMDHLLSVSQPSTKGSQLPQ